MPVGVYAFYCILGILTFLENGYNFKVKWSVLNATLITSMALFQSIFGGSFCVFVQGVTCNVVAITSLM